MRNVRSTKTEPELALRRALRARRVSFNGCNQHLPGKPDLILTNHKIAIFVDGDKFDIYRSNFNCSDGHFIHEDIHRLSASQIPSVTLATASFPCNDLSLAGGRKGLRSGQSSAFWGFVDILSGLDSRKPPLIL